MASSPLVCCVCLTADRQAFTDRAVRCFLRQTYPNARLLIYDTGKVPYRYPSIIPDSTVTIARNESTKPRTIGALRNEAIEVTRADIIATWDSDDVSLPMRLEWQVSELGRDHATGYHNLLFWDSRPGRGHAWEYDYRDRNDPRRLGTSLMFWRAAWAKTPFAENIGQGEDSGWCRIVKPNRINGVGHPQLIAEYHGANSASYGVVEPHWKPIFDRHEPHANPEWRRAVEWDERVRRVMEEA